MTALDPIPWGSDSLNPYDYEDRVRQTLGVVDVLLGSRRVSAPTILIGDVHEALESLQMLVEVKRKQAHGVLVSDRQRAHLLAECCGIETAIKSIERHLEFIGGAK